MLKTVASLSHTALSGPDSGGGVCSFLSIYFFLAINLGLDLSSVTWLFFSVRFSVFFMDEWVFPINGTRTDQLSCGGISLSQEWLRVAPCTQENRCAQEELLREVL